MTKTTAIIPPSAGSPAWGKGLSQSDLMIRDECIVVDQDDHITGLGYGSKREVHTFTSANPRGVLHRAFSVFIFNEDGKLLLQQRAADKITFPSVWTNTCCSHPLHGFEPNEVDDDATIASGAVTGVKNAAIRKLDHELGIVDILPSDFKYLTRLHYWAADVVTHGQSSPWGEHEIDYILFVKKNVKVNPNPEEVKDIKYVDADELKSLMNPSNGLLWSPWFRIIAEYFLLPHWWKDLNVTLTTDKFTDYTKIHRFDPTNEHMGGAGKAGRWLGVASSPYSSGSESTALPASSQAAVGNTALKQGSYGKVAIHKHSLVDQLIRVDEVAAALWFKYIAVMPNQLRAGDENLRFCDDILNKVSRSFAAVIRQLPAGLCVDVMVFYLVLRALDTIEDDMEAFKGKESVKIDHLNNFHRTALVTDGWAMKDVGKGDEKRLLEEFYRCVSVYKGLPSASQEVIADITARMGAGMASYIGRDLGQGTVRIAEYNLYCHYVAGLVGEGLSRLFTCCGYESNAVADAAKTLANTMGLFLQKTNIIRDFLEDYVDGRSFLPQEIWQQYTVKKPTDLGELILPESRKRAVACLNHLVTDALQCVPECLKYMDLLHTKEVFRFCAIPQVMAIATLSDLYNNPKVFTGVVKIRKGLTAKLILESKDLGGLHVWFNKLSNDILSRIPESDPSAQQTREICLKINDITGRHNRIAAQQRQTRRFTWISMIVLAASVYHIFLGSPVKAQNTEGFSSSMSQGKSWKVHSVSGVVILTVIWAMVAWAAYSGGADHQRPRTDRAI